MPATPAEALEAIRQALRDGTQPVALYYMRDNHTFRKLPQGDIDAAIAVLRAEFDDGEKHGMLCTHHPGLRAAQHAHGDWSKFEPRARAWLLEAALLAPYHERSSAFSDACSPAAVTALLAELDALRADAERFEKLGALVAYGSWSVGYDTDAEVYVDDLPDLRARLDAVNAKAEISFFGNAAIDRARTTKD